MKRKAGLWLAVGLLFMFFTTPVYAAREDSAMEAVSGYCLGDELHAFVRLNDDFDMANSKVSLQSDAVTGTDIAAVAPMTETNSTVHYMFMLDLSGSMRMHTNEVNAFAEAVMEQEKQNAFYTVAAFGERFEVVRENLTDKNAVIKVLDELEYTEQLTDPYTGVESALTYLDGYSIRSGDVIHLIVITDGDPDLGYEDDEKQKELAQSAADRIKKTPEIIVSTFCTAEWDETAYETFSMGKGVHERTGSGQDATEAGKDVAEYVDALYRVSFKLSKNAASERFAAQMQIRSGSLEGELKFFDVDLENIPDLKMFSGSGPNVSTQEETPENNNVTAESEVEETETTAESTEEPFGTDTEEDIDQNSEGKGLLFWIIPALAVVIVVVIFAVLLIIKHKRGIKQAKPASGSIMMKLEVYAGNCVTRTTTFYLKDSLIIGSAKKCDLVFADQEVALQNSRIFNKNDMIYIEDLNSKEGTAIGGMRIQGQNRLRSGDVISIGNVEFSFRF